MYARLLKLFALGIVLGCMLGWVNGKMAAERSETFYPADHGEIVWLEEWACLAVPTDGVIQLLDLANEKVGEVILECSSVKNMYQGGYHVYPFEEGIVVMAEHDDRYTAQHRQGAICQTAVGWQLVNVLIYDWEGNLLREFGEVYETSLDAGKSVYTSADGERADVSGSWQVMPYWRGAEKIIFNAGSLLFEYDVSEDVLQLVDDRRAYIPDLGHGAVFWMIRDDERYSMLDGEKFYYAASVDKHDSTALRSYQVDDWGKTLLYEDVPFDSFLVRDGYIMLRVGENGLYYGDVKDDDLREWSWRDVTIEGEPMIDGQWLYWVQKVGESAWHIYRLDMETDAFVRQTFHDDAMISVDLWGCDDEGCYFCVRSLADDAQQIHSYKWSSADDDVIELECDLFSVQPLVGEYYVQWSEGYDAVRIGKIY